MGSLTVYYNDKDLLVGAGVMAGTALLLLVLMFIIVLNESDQGRECVENVNRLASICGHYEIEDLRPLGAAIQRDNSNATTP